MLGRAYRWFEYPHRFVFCRRGLEIPGVQILDVGCGNHSPSLTKSYFPESTYHAADRNQEWNLAPADIQAIDRFFEVDLDETNALSVVPDAAYDVVFCSHVLEHLADPLTVAGDLAKKLRPGGMLFLEVPAPRTVNFPRAADGWMGIRGCLNFHDDPTHKTVVQLDAVRSLLETEGFRVSPVVPRRLWRRVLLLPLYAGAGVVLRGYVPASVVWDAVGFAELIVATAPVSDGL